MSLRMASSRSRVWKATASSPAATMSAARGARQPEDRGARLGVPMRRAEALKGRHEIDARFRDRARRASSSLSAASRSARDCRGAIAPWRRP